MNSFLTSTVIIRISIFILYFNLIYSLCYCFENLPILLYIFSINSIRFFLILNNIFNKNSLNLFLTWYFLFVIRLLVDSVQICKSWKSLSQQLTQLVSLLDDSMAILLKINSYLIDLHHTS